MTKRRKYTPEFKRETVVLTQQPGVSCLQIALDIGINPNLLIRNEKLNKAQIKHLKAAALPGMKTLHDSNGNLPK
ncbi:MAG: hypothetical protein CENE_00869 [Candidatus Celerinatantimonas neptuna]|nr:MAG: hypothetical protein CENE_00869 [Candidatus Celerinatantimonas neptuna]